MGRLDHCFLLKMRDGRSGMAFCAAGERNIERARDEASRALEREEYGQESELAYLGLLDYRQVEDSATDMLGAFIKRGPVWLAFFEAGEAP
ncbi:MAG: hypothetical protein WD314_05945 [Trueperaceae bacterium]